jgi:hypothetical protein
MPGCGQTSFSSSPSRCTTCVPALGLTVIQSTPAGTGRVPFVSSAISKLQGRLAAGYHHQGAAGGVGLLLAPHCRDPVGQRRRIGEAAAAVAIGADEVGIAEATLGTCAVHLAARPEIAAGKAEEGGTAAGIQPLAL